MKVFFVKWNPTLHLDIFLCILNLGFRTAVFFSYLTLGMKQTICFQVVFPCFCSFLFRFVLVFTFAEIKLFLYTCYCSAFLQYFYLFLEKIYFCTDLILVMVNWPFSWDPFSLAVATSTSLSHQLPSTAPSPSIDKLRKYPFENLHFFFGRIADAL